ncbi:L-lactate dehydrogenase (cytochrome) [Altererythrobacter atlanticus]|uniref:L-lactate dehydrogenase n=1 Tax=Croceibacterium atlanticum TaxID=1267766 RepID=A0A0F7KRB9_9SPHN|nr:alpha-hydroxy acid oxidase [Croceibacterium atlanticum]AKH41335.1 L-lactate dehydrogenase [Croceibacterium atlanticum]MBB5734151.1 L-lactate dehydrogenase (cytochrome) [Croceibacterium atlanticum]
MDRPPHRVTSLAKCHNIADFRELAKRRLPYPVFHYIDGAADDESTKSRNTSSFDDADLVPNVLAGVENIDTSVTVLGKKTALPLMLSPTALQRLFHWQGERAVAAAAEKFGLWFGISSLGSVAIEEIGARFTGPKMLQYYYHKDKGLNAALLERARAANFDAVTLTVDTIVGGNRERCQRTGFTTPPKITPGSFLSYAAKPRWGLDFLFREKFELANLKDHVKEGSNFALSVAEYFNTMLDQSLDWKAADKLREDWGGKFCLKGIMSVGDARRAAEIGVDAIMISNHGGRQLDGSRAPFDQLAEIVDAVGDRVEVILDGGVRRGTHVLKALSLGATAVSGGRLYLYALAAAGQAGVERALTLLEAEIVRDMKLMGVTSVDQLSRENLRWRYPGGR